MSLEIHFYPDDYAIGNKSGTLRHLQQKHDLALAMQPKVIVELGVRAGYTAQAFLLACPTAKYIGFDANNGVAGGARDTRYTDFAKQQLSQYDATIYDSFDTQKHTALPVERADLFHVDADHSLEGAQHDLSICGLSMHMYSVILVDDMDMATVAQAVWQFLNMNLHLTCAAISDKNAVIFRRENTEFFKIVSELTRK